MKKTLLFTITLLMLALGETAGQALPDKDWQAVEGPVSYNATDIINIHIAGTGDNEYDRLHLSTGTLTSGGAALNVFPCYAFVPGDRLVIFKAPTIEGEFANPHLVDAGGNFFMLSYEEDDDNNDLVVLTVVARVFGLNINTPGAETVEPDYNYTLHVAADPEAGGTVNPKQETFSVCDEIDIEAAANTGYLFTHWSQEGGAIIAITSSPTTTVTMPADDVELTANFEMIDYTITYNLDGGENHADNPDDFTVEDLDITLEDASKEGNTFEGWFTEDTFDNEVTEITEIGDVELWAKFDIIFNCGTSTITDIDGNDYNTVLIDDQCWMAENLRVTKYNNGNEIPTDLSDDDWEDTDETSLGAYAIYNNDDDMLEAYGKLYNWFAVDDSRGLCPEGWSVPSDADWTQLVDYVVAQGHLNEWNNTNGAANALKSCLKDGTPSLDGCNTSVHPRWDSHSKHYGFDEFGFSALPGGYRWSNGYYGDVGEFGCWWGATNISTTEAWLMYFFRDGGEAWPDDSLKSSGFSVRCLRDAD